MGMSDSALLETPATSNANASSGTESTEKSAGGKAFEAMVSGSDPGDEVDSSASSNETNETASDSTGEENNAAESAEHGGEADAADDSNAESDPLAGLSEGIASIKAMLAPEAKQETQSQAATTESKPGEPDELDKFAVEQWGEDSDTTKNFTKAVDARVNRIVKQILTPILEVMEPEIGYTKTKRISEQNESARQHTYQAIDEYVKKIPALSALYGKESKTANKDQVALRNQVYENAEQLLNAMIAKGVKLNREMIPGVLQKAEMLVRGENADKLIATRQHSGRLAALDTRKSDPNPSQVPQKRVGTSSGAALFEKMKRQ